MEGNQIKDREKQWTMADIYGSKSEQIIAVIGLPSVNAA